MGEFTGGGPLKASLPEVKESVCALREPRQFEARLGERDPGGNEEVREEHVFPTHHDGPTSEENQIIKKYKSCGTCQRTWAPTFFSRMPPPKNTKKMALGEGILFAHLGEG